ncbi:MAG: Tryptophan--tRNA ligase [Arenicellales bacterium IbO2]|nr:tryptophan--tRNA ligase [Gammaproteobacteria bacterium]CAJ2375983.1 MAG: Tryptophan--tRNA ligase [Arenicellales bacterium IbO2]
MTAPPETSPANNRVLSGMRPTGRLHLGHYHGVLKNWARLQRDYECYFFIADWHALTTHYEQPETMREHVWEMVIDWLAAGVDPARATMFIQSHVPEHAELHLLLSMVTPLGWLERVPSFKEQQQRLRGRDLATYGFLGYPLLQSADILMYRAAHVPVGEDQAPHVELTREIARRFNEFFGRGGDAEAAIKRMGKRDEKTYRRLKKSYAESGERDARTRARELISAHNNLNAEDKERLLGDLEGRGRAILPEPRALLTEAAKMPGLDGRKMSKSYENTIALRDQPERVTRAIRAMPTDPARVRLSDPGDPEKCPVWQLHLVYSDEGVREWASKGCRAAAFGCLECKQPLLDAVLAEQKEFHRRAAHFENNPREVRGMIESGTDKARQTARETMKLVREAVGAVYE